MKNFEYIGRLVRESRQRHAKGLTQLQLSQLLGYKNGQFISNVERGLCSIPFKMLKNLGNILDIPQIEIKRALIADFERHLDFYLLHGEEAEALMEQELIQKK